jgi:4,5-dihydroxyphthalate decarboxylase
MARLQLTLACWDYDRTHPLMDGRVKPEGIDLDITVLRPRETFQRMLDRQEFQASELSLASYAALKSRGDCPFVAIPVALSKIFRHSCIYVRTSAGITKPEDLKGKRVGTSQYGSTGLVFMRGMLQHDYGVAPEDMHWFIGGLSSFVEKPLIPMNLPGKVKLDFLQGGATLESMFAAGALDALLSLYIPRMFLAGSSGIARLFPNYRDVEQDYYGRTGIFPIMHTVVVRDDVHRDHPWVATSLYPAPSAPPEIWRSMGFTTPMRCASRCPGSSATSRRRGTSSARTFGPTVSNPIGRPGRQSANMFTSKALPPAPLRPTSCSPRLSGDSFAGEMRSDGASALP